MILGPDGTNGAGWSPYGDTPAEIKAGMKARRFKASIGRVIHVRPAPTLKTSKLVSKLVKLTEK